MTDAAATPVLRTSALVAGYEPDLPIVKGVDLAVEDGDFLVILGPNGAGKSTFVKAIAGLVPVHSGRIVLKGDDITGRAAHELVRAGLAFVPQTENVFTTLSIDENLKLCAGALPAERRAERIEAAYAMFPDLAARRSMAAGGLSGGQRQMLATARALLIEPKVIILDEPSAGLSPKLVGEVFETLTRVNETGVTIVLVEQNVRAGLARRRVRAGARRRPHRASTARPRVSPTIRGSVRVFLGRSDGKGHAA